MPASQSGEAHPAEASEMPVVKLIRCAKSKKFSLALRHGFNHELDRILKTAKLLILESHESLHLAGCHRRRTEAGLVLSCTHKCFRSSTSGDGALAE